MTRCDNSGIKDVYNYRNKILLIQSGPRNITENTSFGLLISLKSLMQHGSFFLI